MRGEPGTVPVLVTKGLLESRQGIDTIVRELTQDQGTETFSWYLQFTKATVEHLHEVRSMLKVEIARLAATQATADEVQQLRHTLADVEVPHGDSIDFVNSDEAFHRTLAKTSHNPLMVVLLDSIRDLMREVRLQVHRYPEVYSTIMPDHMAILQGIAERDPMHTVKPLNTEVILRSARETGALVTAEEHGVLGGLGGAVAEAITDVYPVPLKRVSIADRFAETGPYLALLDRYDMSVDYVWAAARAAVALER